MIGLTRQATPVEVRRAAHGLYMAPAAIDCPTCGMHDEDVLGQLVRPALRHERRQGHQVEIQRLQRWS